ncbi:MAG: ZIP family metal transporter [Methanobacterium sp.]
MVIDINNVGPLSLTLIVTLFTWLLIALGASTVFLTKKINTKILNISLGFAAGILLSVSFFSLILPAIDISTVEIIPTWFPVTAGFILGIFSMFLIHKIMEHLTHLSNKSKDEDNLERNSLLIIALTLHHIPESLALGIVFGAAYVTFGVVSLAGAFSLAIGIGIHNFPEGMAASLPLRSDGMSRQKSFFYGQLTGVTQPIAGILGAILVTIIQPIVPYALGFAAGAMIFVTVTHLIPDILKSQNTTISTLFGIFGFVLMMILELLLG